MSKENEPKHLELTLPGTCSVTLPRVEAYAAGRSLLAHGHIIGNEAYRTVGALLVAAAMGDGS